jgi:hypothetical protein
MLITVIDAEKAEPEMLSAVVQRALNFEHADKCTIWTEKRVPLDAPDYKAPGWLEYGLKIEFTDGGRIFIGCIQRKPGEAIEFHS